MKRTAKLIGLGVLCYLLFLITSLPATVVLAQLPPSLAGTLAGVEGTVWSGKARSLIVQGVELGSLSWSTQPLALLLGRISADLAVRGPELNATAEVTARPNGALRVHRLQAVTSPRLIDRVRPLPAELKGDLYVDVEELEYADGALTDITGEVRWDNAAIGAPYQIGLGQYALALETRDGDIRGTLSEQGSPLRTSGNFLLQPSGQFRLAVRLTPTETTPQELKDLLGLLGKPDRAGGVTLRHQGSLATGPRTE